MNRANPRTAITTPQDSEHKEPHSYFDLDLQTLQTAVRATDAPATSCQHLIQGLQTAVRRYRGDFLDGFSLGDAPDFDDWAGFQREHRHRQMELILDRLSQLQAEGGDTGDAMDTVTRWLAVNPLSEVAYQRLMQLHFAAGDWNAAQRIYEMCRATLKSELGVELAPETEALARRIRDFGLLDRRSAIRDPSAGSGLRLRTGPQSAIDLPLIGRSTEHTTLVAAYHAARQGQTQMVTVEGEAGIGKTRLAREFLGWAAGQGADVLQGRAFEAGGRVPYQPLVLALRPRLERENAPEDLLSDVWLTELSRLLPELRGRYPDLPPPTVGEPMARTRLFEAVARFGEALGQRAPLVLFMDDLQWADTASLDLLHYIASRWTESSVPVLVLLSLRTEALATTPPWWIG